MLSFVGESLLATLFGPTSLESLEFRCCFITGILNIPRDNLKKLKIDIGYGGLHTLKRLAPALQKCISLSYLYLSFDLPMQLHSDDSSLSSDVDEHSDDSSLSSDVVDEHSDEPSLSSDFVDEHSVKQSLSSEVVDEHSDKPSLSSDVIDEHSDKPSLSSDVVYEHPLASFVPTLIEILLSNRTLQELTIRCLSTTLRGHLTEEDVKAMVQLVEVAANSTSLKKLSCNSLLVSQVKARIPEVL